MSANEPDRSESDDDLFPQQREKTELIRHLRDRRDLSVDDPTEETVNAPSSSSRRRLVAASIIAGLATLLLLVAIITRPDAPATAAETITTPPPLSQERVAQEPSPSADSEVREVPEPASTAKRPEYPQRAAKKNVEPKAGPRRDRAKRMSDGVDWIESEGTLVFDGARLAWTPDNATFSGKPVSFRLLDVASIDGGGDKLTLKLKNGERHRFRVPSGKGWATHLRAAQ